MSDKSLIDTFSTGESYESAMKKSSDPHVQQFMQDVAEHQRIEWQQLGREYEVVWNDIPINTNEGATGPYTCPG